MRLSVQTSSCCGPIRRIARGTKQPPHRRLGRRGRGGASSPGSPAGKSRATAGARGWSSAHARHPGGRTPSSLSDPRHRPRGSAARLRSLTRRSGEVMTDNWQSLCHVTSPDSAQGPVCGVPAAAQHSGDADHPRAPPNQGSGHSSVGPAGRSAAGCKQAGPNCRASDQPRRMIKDTRCPEYLEYGPCHANRGQEQLLDCLACRPLAPVAGRQVARASTSNGLRSVELFLHSHLTGGLLLDLANQCGMTQCRVPSRLAGGIGKMSLCCIAKGGRSPMLQRDTAKLR